ncbi:hypothetical protein BS50DRAFT_354421 [Corynespora cassiicola Philippines]|uniref:Uncharacterized protein n=1 Tax=Corynespora cassiicola Philippines TaxID=1448308 RepID=A0A2T2NRG7_CORCC|nr:hypothetical protein BS50DRAFT_354421 [Corynespora cassiicola Philippines]
MSATWIVMSQSVVSSTGSTPFQGPSPPYHTRYVPSYLSHYFPSSPSNHSHCFPTSSILHFLSIFNPLLISFALKRITTSAPNGGNVRRHFFHNTRAHFPLCKRLQEGCAVLGYSLSHLWIWLFFIHPPGFFGFLSCPHRTTGFGGFGLGKTFLEYWNEPGVHWNGPF